LSVERRFHCGSIITKTLHEDPDLSLPSEIYSVESVREIDRAAIEGSGIAGYTLMTRAGQQAVECAQARYPDARRWQIICGAGNNAGDGYVVARLAAQQGIVVSVVSVVPADKLAGDAATAYMDFAADGGTCIEWSGELDEQADLLVDALLGSGLDRPVEGVFKEAVAAINRHNAAVMSLDIPSGIDGDSGNALGAAVCADATITFVGLKSGLFLGEGRRYGGTLTYAGLDIPDECRDAQAVQMRRISHALLADALPPRPRDAHKGDFGHVVVVGGGPGMPGAVAMCGEAALRCGAGRVSIATHSQHAAQITASRPELMCHAIEMADDLQKLIAGATTIAIGPGLGTTEWAKCMFDTAIAADLPKVVDADGLNLMAEAGVRRDDWILTPHPGEASRLLECPTAEIQSDRRRALAGIEAQYGGIAVLKGAGSLVGGADGVPWLCDKGNPGMAAPGMGDVLTGVIAALLAQGLEPGVAAPLGTYLHASAGDAAAAEGERGMLASDLMTHLRLLVNP